MMGEVYISGTQACNQGSNYYSLNSVVNGVILATHKRLGASFKTIMDICCPEALSRGQEISQIRI